jgi:4a-hydroxytetrahydrobiopterin dehydratase
MAILNAQQLSQKSCSACEGSLHRMSSAEAQSQLTRLTGWRLTYEGQRIRKDWLVRNFVSGVEFLNRVAEVAESEGHHPDLHLDGYRNVWIEIWTHALEGLSENDFILAAKIDRLKIELKTPR